MAKRRTDDRCGETGRSADTGRTAAIERAVLELSGEVGYDDAAVATILGRGGANRAWFYATYAGKSDCFARAYVTAAEAFCRRLLDVCAESADPPTGIRAAIAALVDFAAAEPALATGMFAEVHVAGGDALVKRNEVFERLSRAIDRAYRETPGSRHSPPPLAAGFILDALEATLIKQLRDPGSFEDLSEELATLALSYS